MTRISEVRFMAAPERLLPTGLLGWVSFVIDCRLRVGGVAVRRSLQGRTYLSFPARDDGIGKRWEYLKPIDDATRREIEQQVLAQIREVVG